MNAEQIPENHLNSLPLSAIVVKHNDSTLNHKLVFINERFKKELGWSLDEIPDKDTWWVTAYPDPNYQKVVARLWELSVEDFNENEKSHVSMDVNINTKFNGTKRFRVFIEMENQIIPSHYIVMLLNLD